MPLGTSVSKGTTRRAPRGDRPAAGDDVVMKVRVVWHHEVPRESQHDGYGVVLDFNDGDSLAISVEQPDGRTATYHLRLYERPGEWPRIGLAEELLRIS